VLAPTWSTRADADVSGGVFLDQTRKYVVSSTLHRPDEVWPNSTSIGRYDTARLPALKHQVSGDLYVSGSGTLVRALLSDGLVDELHLFVYPLAVGEGARLFPEGGARRLLSLLEVSALSNGVTHLVYGRESADPRQELAAAEG
jgi:dihydrofolate reductase